MVVMGSAVTAGRRLGLTGDTGAPAGSNHVHFALGNTLDREPGFVTIPVAFSNYEILEADGRSINRVKVLVGE